MWRVNIFNVHIHIHSFSFGWPRSSCRLCREWRTASWRRSIRPLISQSQIRHLRTTGRRLGEVEICVDIREGWEWTDRAIILALWFCTLRWGFRLLKSSALMDQRHIKCNYLLHTRTAVGRHLINFTNAFKKHRKKQISSAAFPLSTSTCHSWVFAWCRQWSRSSEGSVLGMMDEGICLTQGPVFSVPMPMSAHHSCTSTVIHTNDNKQQAEVSRCKKQPSVPEMVDRAW